ncbi:class I SAM-dependent methyltransferase [Micropruina sonneratiae]|uniref:class I SAM-dependent methyltransferase n=1 Tax=Micropruina sonneratiae TaxID=2986940 RepID=UPI002227DA16|nr:class I SAM-dependent methyltransferase [Micropruina sp. KQZ13P-5]MCW3159456.1 class I SAM-dependent methyltransferase [Micropruina sp. KQZ13P-5]
MVSTTPFDVRAFATACTTRLVLDLGCGYGRILDQLVSRGMRAVGLDLSMTQLERCRGVHAGSLVNASATALPFADEVFGGVLALGSIDSLTRLSELSSAVTEVARVLEPNAPFWLNFFTVNSDTDFQERYGLVDPSSPHVVRTRSGLTVRHWQVEEVERQLVVSGFEVLASDIRRFLTMHHGRDVAGVQIKARKAQSSP